MRRINIPAYDETEDHYEFLLPDNEDIDDFVIMERKKRREALKDDD